MENIEKQVEGCYNVNVWVPLGVVLCCARRMNVDTDMTQLAKMMRNRRAVGVGTVEGRQPAQT
jgi:hypothetical protein